MIAKKKTIEEFFNGLDRKLFLKEENKQYSHYNQPLPIGFGQTISQPSLVLEMSKLLLLDSNCRVLEIGTGSGYQTAFLAEYSSFVFTVERISELSLRARSVLSKLNYTNIHYRVGDGSLGWDEYSPFDRIIVTAAAGKFPTELFRQLSVGGILLLPIGSKGVQELQVIRKEKNGEANKQTVMMVRFVEFIGEYGHS